MVSLGCILRANVVVVNAHPLQVITKNKPKGAPNEKAFYID